MKYNAVIFDLDGTVLDTLDDLYLSVNFALKKNLLPERTKSEVRSFVGNGIYKLIERAAPTNCSTDVVNKVFEDFREYYKVHNCDNTRPYDFICEMLMALRQEGVKTAVVSNKNDLAVKKLVDTYFNGLFDFAVGDREGVERKPAPDSVFEALRNLNTDIDKSVYVGDSEVDVQTSKNAGIACVCVSWGFRNESELICSGATEIVSSVEELKNKLM